MNSNLKLDPDRLLIYHELTRTKIYVGELIYDRKTDKYKLIYDEDYINSKNAIPIGPNLSLFQTTHVSKKGEMFPEFLDRIPERQNPAYEDYCRSQGISIDEKNTIILLGSIGSRGPSSFVFEKTYKPNISLEDIIKCRHDLKISQNDFSKAFGISKVTLQKIEAGTSFDFKTIKLLQIFFTFPEVAMWQLHQTGSNVHSKILSRLLNYFYRLQQNSSTK